MSDDETQFKIMNEKDDFSKERARGNTFSNYPRPYFKSVFFTSNSSQNTSFYIHRGVFILSRWLIFLP